MSHFKAVWMMPSGGRIEWYSNLDQVYMIAGSKYALLDVDPVALIDTLGEPLWM